MTVIAFDGKTIAADKRAGVEFPRAVTKIFRLESGELIGFAGWIDRGLILVDWWIRGADPAKLPDWQRDEAKACTLMIVKPDGSIWMMSDYGLPWRVEEKFHAIGSGRDFAAAAMYLGKTASEAVAVASALCGSCGNGIDTLTLEAS